MKNPQEAHLSVAKKVCSVVSHLAAYACEVRPGVHCRTTCRMAWGPRTILPSPWVARACQVRYTPLPSRMQNVLLPGLAARSIRRRSSLLSRSSPGISMLSNLGTHFEALWWFSQSVERSGSVTLVGSVDCREVHNTLKGTLK